ncbi:hypothetical protein FGB62_11g14 [Gracilaria domingensis]|nr:hypothetical protein FGB62_11g14 [Gracilaria domingensis]
MQGPVRFDIAVMPVIVDRSISECNMGDSSLLDNVSMQNKELFERVADNMFAELDTTGVPDNVYERVVLMPLCRLGAHAQGFEGGCVSRVSTRFVHYRLEDEKSSVHHSVAQLPNPAERNELDHVRTAAGSDAETGFNGGFKLKLLRAGAPKNREGGSAARLRTGLPRASADFVHRRRGAAAQESAGGLHVGSLAS